MYPKLNPKAISYIIEQLKEDMEERFINSSKFDLWKVKPIQNSVEFWAGAYREGKCYYQWNMYLDDDWKILQFVIMFDQNKGDTVSKLQSHFYIVKGHELGQIL